MPFAHETGCPARVSGINHKNEKHGPRLLETRRIKSQFRAQGAGLGSEPAMGNPIPVPFANETGCPGRVSGINHKHGKHGPRSRRAELNRNSAPGGLALVTVPCWAIPQAFPSQEMQWPGRNSPGIVLKCTLDITVICHIKCDESVDMQTSHLYIV